ncbi:hypothetical protein [Citricoccus sp. SGAir0253]|uniref:hypothetical protein n=1 Tax=Citricoccus sp. SGAir0253 TaxID=2567881 RepID=UPI001AEFDEA9|nr:hypothetical protein [Citricoccus sp. SGAir0253]
MHEYERVHPLVKDNTGLSLGYRILWRIRYAANDVYGPASRQPSLNPREQLRVERAQRVATAYRTEGREPPPEVRRAAGEDVEGDAGEQSPPPWRRQPKPFQEGYRYVLVEDDESSATGEGGTPGTGGTPASTSGS